jgi:ABC-type dipeptide/oligopeptide/nickel transport system ATPase component
METIQRHHNSITKKGAQEMAIELFRKVKIPSAEKRMDEFPAMFSGGMIQRVMIADALSSNPKFIIADNPTQALDVTIQAQILELINELRNTFGTTIILITNSLPILAKYAQDICFRQSPDAALVNSSGVHFSKCFLANDLSHGNA